MAPSITIYKRVLKRYSRITFYYITRGEFAYKNLNLHIGKPYKCKHRLQFLTISIIAKQNNFLFPNECKNSLSISHSLSFAQELLYHRTCKPDFLCSWSSLNSYLK